MKRPEDVRLLAGLRQLGFITAAVEREVLAIISADGSTETALEAMDRRGLWQLCMTPGRVEILGRLYAEDRGRR